MRFWIQPNGLGIFINLERLVDTITAFPALTDNRPAGIAIGDNNTFATLVKNDAVGVGTDGHSGEHGTGMPKCAPHFSLP